MIFISKYAYKVLFDVLIDNLSISIYNAPPPIFYWYRKVIIESLNIEQCSRLRKGEHKYVLGYSLGIAHINCDYVGKERIIIITNYEINTSVLFSWGNAVPKRGVIPKIKEKHILKNYRKLRTKPLFGYSFVMNDKKEYNLIDDNGKLLTQWFKSIKPINKPEPYGKYQIIAYINVGSYFCALGYDGKVYNLNKTWKEMCAENRQLLNTTIFISIITEQIDKNMKNKITLTESKLNKVVENAVKEMLTEMQMDRKMNGTKQAELFRIF